MAGRSTRVRRWILIAGIVCAALFALMAAMTWPRMFISEGRELTGTGIELTEMKRFDLASREGSAAVVCRIDETHAAALDADRQSLHGYPMWCALAFDGYKRVRWQTLDQLKTGPDALLAEWVFLRDSDVTDPSLVQTEDDARQLARSIAQQKGSLICGWYTQDGGAVTNHFVYVLDLKRRLLIKLTLLT